MKALKNFLSSFHFITLTVFCLLSMLLFVGLLDLPSNKSLKDAKASVAPSPDSVKFSRADSSGIAADDESFDMVIASHSVPLHLKREDNIGSLRSAIRTDQWNWAYLSSAPSSLADFHQDRAVF